MSNQENKRLWQRLFPPAPNFLQLLGLQLAHSRRAMDAFQKWCDTPNEATMAIVFQIEKEADIARRDIALALSSAFITPLDREDIDDLSERLDDIVDAVRHTVREAMALHVVPDEPIRTMISNLQESLVEMQHSIGALPKEPGAATSHASRAQHFERVNERIYTNALAALLEFNDFRHVFRQREVYRQMLHISELVTRCAKELERSIYKLG